MKTFLKILAISASLALSGCGIGVCASSAACSGVASSWLSVAGRSGKNIITWPAAAGATSYNLYWSTSSTVTKYSNKISGLTSTSYAHAGLTDGVPYYYAVAPVSDIAEGYLSQQGSAAPSTNFFSLPQQAPGYVDYPYALTRAVFADDTGLYVATSGGGLGISTDGGVSFSARTTFSGLGNNVVYGVYTTGTAIYAATIGGLSISTDGGTSFSNKTTAQGLGNNLVNGVYATSSAIYAATNGGLSISTDGGTSFSNKTTAQGLGSNTVRSVYVTSSAIYAAAASMSDGGLSAQDL